MDEVEDINLALTEDATFSRFESLLEMMYSGNLPKSKEASEGGNSKYSGKLSLLVTGSLRKTGPCFERMLSSP